MGTLWSELASVADEGAGRSARLRRRQRSRRCGQRSCATSLGWDVLFVIEHDDLRRAHDIEHFRLARQLRRTLITMDRDYLDDREFPPQETAGVVVLSAPDERGLAALLERVNRDMFHPNGHGLVAVAARGQQAAGVSGVRRGAMTVGIDLTDTPAPSGRRRSPTGAVVARFEQP